MFEYFFISNINCLTLLVSSLFITISYPHTLTTHELTILQRFIPRRVTVKHGHIQSPQGLYDAFVLEFHKVEVSFRVPFILRENGEGCPILKLFQGGDTEPYGVQNLKQEGRCYSISG